MPGNKTFAMQVYKFTCRITTSWEVKSIQNNSERKRGIPISSSGWDRRNNFISIWKPLVAFISRVHLWSSMYILSIINFDKLPFQQINSLTSTSYFYNLENLRTNVFAKLISTRTILASIISMQEYWQAHETSLRMSATLKTISSLFYPDFFPNSTTNSF